MPETNSTAGKWCKHQFEPCRVRIYGRMSDDQPPSQDELPVAIGEALYDDDGERVGVVDGVTDEGLEVVIEADPGSVDEGENPPQHEDPPSGELGEGHLMWRCDQCGEMGDLEDGMPDSCPNCGAPKEDLYRAKED